MIILTKCLLREDHIVFPFLLVCAISLFVYFWQLFNPVVLLVNLSKCIMNAREWSVSVAIKKSTDRTMSSKEVVCIDL